MELRNLKTGEPPLIVTHLQHVNWVDDDAVADEEHFEDIDLFIHHIKAVRKVDKPKPVTVHCSAGIGRTGTLLAIYAILESIEKFEEMGDKI
jgi:protein tyrosine phosphatase